MATALDPLTGQLVEIGRPTPRPPSHHAGEVVVGRRFLDADALDGPIGVPIPNLPAGPLAAFVQIEGGAVRWAIDGGLVAPDEFGKLAPAGTSIDVLDARGLRIVGAEPGARATVTLKRPAPSR